MITLRINKFVSLIFVLGIAYMIIPRVLAGGGPQIYCKEMAVKQGWLIDKSQNTEDLSSEVCKTRDQTPGEKEEFTKFCNQEPTEDFKNDCLNKCSKYYSYTANEYQYCTKAEILNKKVSAYSGSIEKFLNSGTLLATVIITSATVTVFYVIISLFKKLRKSSNS